MYHKELQICIFYRKEKPLSIIHEFQLVKPMERFTHKISCFDVLTKENVEKGDLLILSEGADREELRELMEWRKSGSRVVFCGSQKQIVALMEEDFTGIDRLWILPETSAMLQFEIQSLLRDIKEAKEAWQNQAYLEALLSTMEALVWMKDAKGAHLKVSDSFCKAVGKTREQIRNRGHYYIWDIPKEEYDQGEYICLESEEETMEKRCTCEFDENVKTKKGMRRFHTSKIPIFDEEKSTVLGTVGIARDVTEYQNISRQMNLLLNNLPISVLVCDLSWRITNANRHLCQYYGKADEEIVGQDYLKWKKERLQDIKEAGENGSKEAVFYREGERLYVQYQETELKDVFGMTVGYLCIFVDITQNRAYEEYMMTLANTDMLTGMGTRRHFFEEVERRGIPKALMFIDLDDFKTVNDRYGHHIGDKALQVVAEAIRNGFPEEVTARLGGDEFAIGVYGSCSGEELEQAALALQAEVDGAGLEARISVSVGISVAEDSSLPIDKYMQQSDIAMYMAKHRGKRQCAFYDPEWKREELEERKENAACDGRKYR